MKSEFDEPIYPGVGVPEPPRVPRGYVSLEGAAAILRTDIDGVMRLINEGSLRKERSPYGLFLVLAEDIYHVLVARQKG